MSSNEIQELRERILEGMKISSRKLIAEKKRLNLPVVISENGIIREIEARDLPDLRDV